MIIRFPSSVARSRSLAAVLAAAPFIGPVAWAGPNFAKYRSAFASGSAGTYDPTFATDGVVDNFHSHRIASTTDPHWVEIRFPAPVRIGSAHVYLGLGNNPARSLKEFKFQFRNSNNHWVDVPGSQVTGNTATERVVMFPTAPQADRFRLYSDEDGNPVIREIALYPPNPVDRIDQGYPLGTDVALSLTHRRPATASSINGSHYPKHAVDGYVNNSARWLSAGIAAGDWLEVDLLESQPIGSAHIHSGWDGVNAIGDFELQYWTGSAWQVIPGSSVSGNTDTALALEFSSTVNTSKVRLRTTTASTARIKEFLVFPPKTGGYPLGQDVVHEDPPAAKWDDYSDNQWRLRNSGPDLRLALIDGEIRFINNNHPRELLEWQLLLNHRDGTYRVRHVATGLCLSQPDQDSAAGDPAIAEWYGGLPWQDWKLQFTTGSEFQLLNAWSGLALRSRDGIWGDGNPIDLATPDGGALQRWTAGLSGHHPKKGLAGYEASYNQFNAAWSYRWSRENPTWHPFWHSFNPMQWGGWGLQHGNSGGPLEKLRPALQISPKPTHLLGFNEPDKADQANMTVSAAIDRWPRLEAMDLPLVAPAPASAFGGWLATFVNQADARGYRRDYTAVHWYSGPDANALISHLQQNHNTFGRPVWLTEFSTVRWSGGATWTHADNWNFLAEFMWRAESLPWLKRYSIFQFTEGTDSWTDPAAAPRSNVRKSGGGLTPFGQLYASWDGVAQILENKAYHLHNRAEYQRMTNPGGGIPGVAAPAGSDLSGQWLLVPGNNAGTHRILSITDGRPLRYVNGGDVSLGISRQSDASVEWQLVENQHGWFFLRHVQTNKRLKDYGTSFGMVDNTNTGHPIQWRFVVPTAPGDASQPAAPASLAATAGGDSIQLTWPAVAGATAYQIHRSATPGGPYSTVVAGLAPTTWTDSGLPAETTRHYVVTATNGIGLVSGNSPEASATTPHPFETFAGWAEVAFASAPPGSDMTATGNPDHDSLENLLEFAFLTDPLVPQPLPFTIRRLPGGQLTLHFPWNRRTASHTWRIRHGNDLAAIAAWPVLDPGVPEISPAGDRDFVTITPALPPGARGFFVLEVIGAP